MTNREYFVIDGDGHISFDVQQEMPDAFASLKQAQKRAADLAKSEPGHTVVIAQAVEYVSCPVGPPKTELKRRKLKG